MSPAAQTADDPTTLVNLLQTAAQIEHCLLLSYLFAACSLRSTPQEFETLGNGQPNARRAIQFELVRGWKQKIITTAVEEMLHLHYVQCLLRAIGERPHFILPERDGSGDWVIAAWNIDPDSPPEPSPGTRIGLGPVTPDRLQQFITYESTDAVEQQELRGAEITDLFAQLYQGELDLHFESMLLNVADAAQRAEIKRKLGAIYAPAPIVAVARDIRQPPAFRFQSIDDLYRNRIEPLYQKAFEQDRVLYSNLMLNNELFDPNSAGRIGGRLVPTGPVQRSNRFGRLIQKCADDPLRNFKRVEEIVEVILGEGEGMIEFQKRAKDLLEKWGQEGTRPYAQGLVPAVLSSGAATPKWMTGFELVRQSHLYRFGMILQGMLEEQRCCGPDQGAFDPNRQRLDIDSLPELRQMSNELPAQVGACYLVLIAWMSRVYEIQNWMIDKDRRSAIEMLAAWPLMSLGVRPLLELLSFFPSDSAQLFQAAAAADSSPLLRQLAALYSQTDRTEQDNAQMDSCAADVLAATAVWARKQIEAVRSAPVAAQARQMILARLQAVSHLDEFQKQFPYRVAGGYSNRMPSLDYQQRFPDSARFEEDPFQHKPASQKPQNAPPIEFPVFSDSLVLRLRYSGWALAQLATDPDPCVEEVGCSGSTMLHPADGNRQFDRSIVWQPSDHAILREPRDKLPEIGVTCKEISLLVANGAAQVGYVPFPTHQLPGALQIVPVQQELGVDGLLHVLTLRTQEILGEARKIRVDLTEKNGTKPFFNGLNHIVWQDGEPIDPFVLTMTADPAPPATIPVNSQVCPNPPSLVLQREVYNQNLSLLEMTPLQRLLSSRGPCGLATSAENIPGWALSDADRQALHQNGFPTSYLRARAGVLLEALSSRLASGGESQADIDQVVSFAERLALATTPKAASQVWLNFFLHYGHTLSGDVALGDGLNEVISAFASRTGLQLGISYTGARYATNSRWLVKYACGVMDVDALSNLVYGELFIPVTLTRVAGPIELAEQWTFPAGIMGALSALACQFSKPFWAGYQVNGNTRTLTAQDTTIVETLQPSSSSSSYSYSLSGLAGVTSCQCQFAAAATDTGTTLTWRVTLSCSDSAGAFNAVGFIAGTAKDMKSVLMEYFRPKP